MTQASKKLTNIHSGLLKHRLISCHDRNVHIHHRTVIQIFAISSLHSAEEVSRYHRLRFALEDQDSTLTFGRGDTRTS